MRRMGIELMKMEPYSFICRAETYPPTAVQHLPSNNCRESRPIVCYTYLLPSSTDVHLFQLAHPISRSLNQASGARPHMRPNNSPRPSTASFLESTSEMTPMTRRTPNSFIIPIVFVSFQRPHRSTPTHNGSTNSLQSEFLTFATVC